jgi:substrate import-associated zinc metallohydrolase lipoprotein
MREMMKKIIYIIYVAVTITAMTSCRGGDDFTESIFDTSIPVLDENSATYPFDKWLFENFIEPYNVDVKYRFDLSSSDLGFQLTPADYNRSQLLAHFIKFLFYDVYTTYGGEDFMKKYGPRIFHFIGSSGYSPTTGTEVLGTASGGVKITLYNVNEMKPYGDGAAYNGEDIAVLNERYFHTMHHEFSHVLHQTKSYPVTFGQVTSGTYDPNKWQERDSVWTHSHGYVTHYASSANYEDFVETLSCIITDSDVRWMNRIINGAVNGVRQGDKEDILELIDSLEIKLDTPNAHWNDFALYEESEYNVQTEEYDPTNRYVLDDHRLLPDERTHQYQVVNKDHDAYVSQYKYKLYRKFTSFKDDFLPWVKISYADDLTGINSLMKKLDIATKWHQEKWGLYTYTLRREVRNRQDKINDFIKDEVTIYDLK